MTIDNNLLQSEKWQKLQKDLGKKTFYEQTADYTYLAILEKTPVLNYLYVPYGPTSVSPSSFNEAIEALTSLAKKQNASFIRIEPRNAQNAKILINKAKFHNLYIKKTKDLNPKETWIIDISGEETEVKNKIPSRLLRYYRNAAKNGLTIETSKNPDDIKYLVDLQKALAKTKKINIFSEEYLRTELKQDFATLYLVKYKNPEEENAEPKVVAAGLVFDDKTTRYNLQGAQDEEFRRFHATGILTVQLILDAKAKDLKLFDCWGIAPENAPKNHPWAGFTAFKKTFDGEEVDFAGTWDLILNRNKYRTYSIMRKINRLRRKI
jgi:lipid II:glycine glycyltransferase (peptidoglycan interpeptide bridge formation enzyme)